MAWAGKGCGRSRERLQRCYSLCWLPLWTSSPSPQHSLAKGLASMYLLVSVDLSVCNINNRRDMYGVCMVLYSRRRHAAPANHIDAHIYKRQIAYVYSIQSRVNGPFSLLPTACSEAGVKLKKESVCTSKPRGGESREAPERVRCIDTVQYVQMRVWSARVRLL